MSFATEMLAKAQLAYQTALENPQYVQVNNRRVAQQIPADLLKQVEYWQRQVDLENAKASGDYSHIAGPIRFNL